MEQLNCNVLKAGEKISQPSGCKQRSTKRRQSDNPLLSPCEQTNAAEQATLLFIRPYLCDPIIPVIMETILNIMLILFTTNVIKISHQNKHISYLSQNNIVKPKIMM